MLLLPTWLPYALALGAAALLLLALAWRNRSLHLQLAEARAQLAAQGQFREALQALSAEALERNSRQFLDLAGASLGQMEMRLAGEGDKRGGQLQALVGPLTQMLAHIEARLREVEAARVAAYAGLTQTVQSLGEGQLQLRAETQKLASALSQPGARGRWGELQLRRVVELAGMVQHCDFSTQVHGAGSGDSEPAQRPDLIVHLPGGRSIVVDAKVPLDNYLAALEVADGHGRAVALKRHAAALRAHQRALAQKGYWTRHAGQAADFTVLFLPAEPILAAAVEADPTLLEAAAQAQVLIATPMTLIAMLRAVGLGWRQEKLAENALQMRALGAELTKRLGDLTGHVSKLGQSLSGSVRAYNAMLGSLESRVLVTARRFQALETDEEAAQASLPLPPAIEVLPRPSVEAAE